MDSLRIASPRRLLALAVILGSCSSLVHALDLKATVGTTVEHTDNGLKNRSEQKRSEVESRLWAVVGAAYQGPDLNADLGYRLTRTWYKHHTQDRDTTAEGDALLRWQILDQRLFLNASHSRRKVLQDSAEVDLLSNREDRDITTVSPSYILRLGAVDSVNFTASWTDVSYDKRGERDSQRYGANITWSHQLSAVNSLLVSANSTKIENRSSRVPDYRYDALSVGYSAQLARLSYTVMLGANQAKREGGKKDVDGALVDIDARYNSGFNTLTLTARHGISDSSLANGNRVLEDFYSYDSSRNNVDIMKETRVMLDWTTSAICGRCTFRLAAFAEKEDYEEQPDDNTELGAEARFHYDLTRTSRVGIMYRYRDLHFTGRNTRANYTIDEARLSFDQQIGQNLRAGIFVGWEERDSRRGGTNYDVFSGGLTLSYRFL